MSNDSVSPISLNALLKHRTRLLRIGVGVGIGLVLTLGPTTQTAFASITKIGNGDDGGDLEGGKLVKSGILIETRNKALDRVRRLGTENVDNLGTLIPELEKSDIYLVTRDVAPKMGEDKGMEGTKDGVYARTFAEPHAATRFFPAALTLNEEQLIALHIHEALHRSLPAQVRENEDIVTKITLAIAAPDASLDRVRRVVAAELKGQTPVAQTEGEVSAPGSVSAKAEIRASETVRASRPSSVTYTYKSFFLPAKEKSSYPIDSVHSVTSVLYPFGIWKSAFGLGMELSYLKTPDQQLMGPLNLSARVRLGWVKDYDISGYVSHSLNSYSADEIKNSPLGRDVTTVGVNLRRDESDFYIENNFSVALSGEADRTISNVKYTYEYGNVYAATVRAGGKHKGFELGGFAEVVLADSFKVRGTDDYTKDSGRFRIIGIGPEFSYTKDALKFSTSARWVIDSTPNIGLDEVGDLMGRGIGQGFVSGSATLRF